MTTTTTDSAALRSQLVDRLVAEGFLHEPRWQQAFLDIPREAFVDKFTVHDPATGRHTHYDLNVDTATPLAAVYDNVSLLTQLDEGGTATSSSTTPSLMALMLERLDVHPGHRVLEIGTGTGYNAALLCHELGDHSVTSIDIDPSLVEQARTRLAEVGYGPRLVVGDGALGEPSAAPYDRIIATCGLPRVPATWLDQVRPGGIILVNLGFALARLTVSDDGTASGRFTDYAAFMRLRTDINDTAPTVRDIIETANQDGTASRSLWPAVLEERPVQCLHAIVHPHVRRVVVHGDDGDMYALVDPVSSSWARARLDDSGNAVVVHGGPRNPWTGLVELADWWDNAGHPEPTRFGLTISPDGRHVLWLDQADATVMTLPT
ncbi:methyltransferase domain-containing protein [Saccharomonospora azurea]|uniref:Protein-L-isoaspartate O-methyltransferase n=1 Tax=Saccharomonospora azurea NA-128 TaxID=882081 RepID=H8G6Z7_9PSEU|nr:methyltransferase domain-containing protein [Saccharomonospora azurea]EHY87266.1 protein-L-isoaspartate carboxylmethyltransferase [Saccharomonospora azurea NA-128]